jgi:hypothetical protein
MNLKVQKKGKKIILVELEFKEYMSKKLDELTGMASNVVAALIMVSMLVLLNSFMANDYLFWALLLIPLAGRYYLSTMLNRWLKNKFKELLDI